MILSWLPIFVLTILSVEGKTYDQVALAWFTGWHATEGFPPSKVSWSKYTHLTYAFAETTPDVQVLTLNGSNPDILPQFVEEAHLNGVNALISIGGWTGSRYFSSNVGSAENRTAFVKTVTDFATEFNLDGLDFDWEFPTKPGVGCNTINNDDTANFLLFLQELRKHPLGCNLILSAATNIVPFTGSDGTTPLTDVSGFANLLDFIEIMNYDIWGPWSATVGPNAPLNDTCAAAQNQAGSAIFAVKKWHAAGFPFEQIVLGVPAYGHSFEVNKTNAFLPGSTDLLPYPKFNSSAHPKGDSWDNNTALDVCGNPQNNGGTVDFWGLIELGYLNPDGTPKKGIFYRYDDCSQTPYVYNDESQIMVSYDNAQSFAAKGNYIRDTKLRGFAIWEAGGDYHDILLNSIREAAGYGVETADSTLSLNLPLINIQV